MKSVEKLVKANSNYYAYSPSQQGKKTFLYPTHTGLFYYEKGYTIKRERYESFLVMLVQKGKISVESNGENYLAEKGQVVILNCFEPHAYSAECDSIVLWVHFDGVVAKEYFKIITEEHGTVLTLRDSFVLEKNMNKIYDLFHKEQPVKEALMSKFLTNILTTMIIDKQEDEQRANNSSIIENIISYINENLSSKLSLEILAQQASLSPYYFTRVFTKETGFTPYQYILNSRINHAKFLLKQTALSVKEICFECGFTCESNFCASFKKKEKITPSDYRKNM